jgi:hypothetical protein
VPEQDGIEIVALAVEPDLGSVEGALGGPGDGLS